MVSTQNSTVLLLDEYGMSKLPSLYRFSRIVNKSHIIGNDKAVTNLQISLVRNSKVLWWIVFSLDVSKISLKELTWSLLGNKKYDCLGNENKHP